MRTKPSRNTELDLYRILKDLKAGGTYVTCGVGSHSPERQCFTMELPRAGGRDWEPLLWRVVRDRVYRELLDQVVGGIQGEHRVTVEFRFRRPNGGDL